MGFALTTSGVVAVLRPTGTNSDSRPAELKRMLSGLIARGSTRIVVNLERADRMDYRALGTLVEWLRTARASNGDLKLACVNGHTTRLLELAGASHIFEMHETEAAAVHSFVGSD